MLSAEHLWDWKSFHAWSACVCLFILSATLYDYCKNAFGFIGKYDLFTISIYTGIPVCQQHLIYKELELEDEYCLEEYKWVKRFLLVTEPTFSYMYVDALVYVGCILQSTSRQKWKFYTRFVTLYMYITCIDKLNAKLENYFKCNHNK